MLVTAKKRRNTVLPDPEGTPPTGTPRDVVAIEFARKLQQLMIAKGWNQSELARQAKLHMPEGEGLSRDSISLYMNAKVLPNAIRLTALAKALGVEREELLAHRGVTAKAKVTPPVDLRDAGDGTVWLRTNQRVSWADALKILEILKGGETE